MDQVTLHLALNHFPLSFLFTGWVILAVGLWKKNETVIHTGLALFIASGVATLPVYLSGEGAAEVVNTIDNTASPYINDHSEAAASSIYIVMVNALAALAYFFVEQLKNRRWLFIVMIIGLVTLASTGYVASTGGKIRHSEIR